MDVAPLLQTYGYPLLAVACLLEGESVLALAGFAAHQGHLHFGFVVAVAAVAGFAGDQCFFWLGRWRGAQVLARYPSIAREADRVHRLVDRWHAWMIVGVRFAYGLRIAGPVLIGTSALPAWRFALFNALGAALWAPLVAGAGWFFGTAVEAVLGEVHRFELWALLLVAFFAGGWLLRRWRRRAHP